MNQGPKFDRFSRDVGDGRYLIRPYGGFGGVYNVDEIAKEKFLKFRKISGAPPLLIFLAGSFLSVPPIPLLFALLVWATIDIYMRQRYVKTGFKVDKKEWTPAPNLDTGPLFPRWAYLFFVPALLALLASSLGSIYQLYSRFGTAPIESWVFVVLWLYLLWLCSRDLKKKKITKSPAEAGPSEPDPS